MPQPRYISQPIEDDSTGMQNLFVIALVAVLILMLNPASGQTQDERTNQTRNQVGAVPPSTGYSEATQRPSRELYAESIIPLIKRTCFDCHSGDTVEGNFHADQLDADLVGGADTAWWLEVYSVLSKGEMPPPESSELTDDDRARIVDWFSKEIQLAEDLRKTSGNHSSFRRLTRYEYNYALQDLLGVPWTFSNDLPDEASEDDAFENNADSLHMSVRQIETYHRLALDALNRVTVRGERPPEVHWAIPMKDAFQREKKRLDRSIESAKEKFEDMPEKLSTEIERLREKFQASADRTHYLDVATGLRAEAGWGYRKASYAFRESDNYKAMPEAGPEAGPHFAVVQPGNGQALTVELGDRLPDEGMMRVRIRASRAEDAGQRIPSLQLRFGFQATDQGRSITRVSHTDLPVEATYGQPRVYQWNFPLSEIEHRNTYRGKTKLGQQLNPSEYIRFTNSTVGQDEANADSAAVLIDYVDVAAPIYKTWPPQSHCNVFVDSENADDEPAYAREIIVNFMNRAWRKPPISREVDRKLDLFHRVRPSCADFQEAIIEVLATVLTSPKFLYVLPDQQATADEGLRNVISQHDLATRLSLFLWCSLPDETLLKLATEGHLGDHEVLRQQVDRMLLDPRATRFAKQFVVQWLKMQPLEFLSPTRGDDGLDEALLESMKWEPIALFEEMLHHDSSVLDFIDADYVVVNERLGIHYGISGVRGNDFRRVPGSAGLNRGGLLTQAGLLTMNSDGQDSHPVKRGVWLLTNLLNDPPPPPPPAVPEIDLSDPAIAEMTLKERIEDHRNHAACLSCHKKIDPWGIAFENYDALGRWRDQINGKDVDATSALPNRANLDGMKGLKSHLMKERQQLFVRAMVEKMVSFALGRRLHFGDRAGVREITLRVRQSGDGIATMVKRIVTSELFQTE